jgi:hypothetical protein
MSAAAVRARARVGVVPMVAVMRRAAVSAGADQRRRVLLIPRGVL